jgi:hypothetical protein
MGIRSSVVASALLLSAQQSVAQQPQANVMTLAQALDRCMTTQAVRLTHTSAADSEIYAQARQSCQGLNDQLRAAIAEQLPPADAAQILASIDGQAEPNFMTVLSRIRQDRARRAGQ